jgi:hypothetical protein
MQDVHIRRALIQAVAYALYPWIADPRVKLVWYSRVVYVLCVVIAVFGHKQCLMISELVVIQLFFTMIGMSGKSGYSLNFPLLRTVATVVYGVVLSAIVTLALFCFEGAKWLVVLVAGGAVQYDYVFYLSSIIFVVLMTTWLLATRTSNATDHVEG